MITPKQMLHLIYYGLCLVCLMTLSGCNGFFDKDNAPTPAPLPNYAPSISPKKLWTMKVGGGQSAQFIKTNPALSERTIYVANDNGMVSAIDKATGNIRWQHNLHTKFLNGPDVKGDT